MKALYTFAVITLLAGCGTTAPLRPNEVPPTRPETETQATERRQAAPRPTYNLTGYPPAVRDGYIDGCETAKHSSYGRKDVKRMADDAQYSMGWNDGFSICQKK